MGPVRGGGERTFQVGLVWCATGSCFMIDTPSVQATEEELRVLASKFGDLGSVPESGVDLGGVHYIVPLD